MLMRLFRRSSSLPLLSAIIVLLWCELAAADSPPAEPDAAGNADQFDLYARSETYVRFFERALLPGPAGARVSVDSVVPVHEYLTLRAQNVDAPWATDSVDVELSAWQGLHFGQTEFERTFDGDITSANVRQRYGPLYLRLGRQVVAGGAARYARFDGFSAGAAHRGFGGDAYAGWTVLPRWNGRPGYEQLGSAFDTLVREPEAFPEPQRNRHWVAGGRLGYTHGSMLSVAASFHEQREETYLSHRNAGLDLVVEPLDLLEFGAKGVVDLDAQALSDFRTYADVRPIETLTVTGEYLRTVPALFLSRQSVLSVFSVEDFDEVGAGAAYRPFERLEVGGAGYVQFFSLGRRGLRTTWRVRGTPDPDQRLLAQLVYTRVNDVENGYHSLRAALRYAFLDDAAATAEQYFYIYDQAINGVSTSLVEVAALEWTAAPGLSLLGGTSLFTTPTAALDIQLLARLTYQLDAAIGGRR